MKKISLLFIFLIGFSGNAIAAWDWPQSLPAVNVETPQLSVLESINQEWKESLCDDLSAAKNGYHTNDYQCEQDALEKEQRLNVSSLQSLQVLSSLEFESYASNLLEVAPGFYGVGGKLIRRKTIYFAQGNSIDPSDRNEYAEYCGLAIHGDLKKDISDLENIPNRVLNSGEQYYYAHTKTMYLGKPYATDVLVFYNSRNVYSPISELRLACVDNNTGMSILDADRVMEIFGEYLEFKAE